MVSVGFIFIFKSQVFVFKNKREDKSVNEDDNRLNL